MKKVIIFSAIVALILSAYCSAPSLKIKSSAFSNNSNIPQKYTCEGKEVSPPLTVSGIPPGTKSLALIVHDPDAPLKGGFTHWVVWNISPSMHEIPEGFNGAEQGLNSAKRAGYIGMCPPSGTHHYHFKIFALDVMLDISKQSDKDALEKNMKDHVIAQSDLVGLYKKIRP